MPVVAQSDRPPPSSLAVVQDRILSVGVRLVDLCPRMDLVAIVLDGNTVAVLRRNWQRLVTIPPAPDMFGDITVVTWAPDGSALALASATGRVRVVPIEAAATSSLAAFASQGGDDPNLGVIVLRHAVSALHWVEVPHNQPAAYDDRDSPGPDPRGMIAVGDANGGVTFLSFNLAVTVASVQLLPEGQPVSRLCVSTDGETCVAAGEQSSSVVLRSLSLESLCASRSEVHRAGAEAVVMTSILAELERTSQVCRDSWLRDAIGGLSKSIVDPLASQSFDHAENNLGTPWVLLNNAFCGGGVAGALEQFLASDLSEAGAKEVLRVFCVSSDLVRDAIAAALPLAQRTVFRASEYRGLARIKHRFGRIGVTVAAADRVFTAAQHVLDQLGMLAIEIDQADKQIRSFLRWLIAAASFATGEDPEAQRAALGGERNVATDNDPKQTALFFSEVLASGDGEVAYVTVKKLYSEFAEIALGELQTSLRELFASPTRAMTSALGSSLSSANGKARGGSVVVPWIAEGSVSLVSCGSQTATNDSERYVEAIFMTDPGHMSIVRYHHRWQRPQSSLLAPWSSACIRVTTAGRTIRAVAHGPHGHLTLLSCVSGCASEMVGYALSSGQMPDRVNFRSSLCEQLSVGTQNNDADTSIDFADVEVCSAPMELACTLRVETQRSLATVLMGTRRVVLFNLQSSAPIVGNVAST
jgi:Anaphase-promoting complex subunit 4 WD40 domain/Anaphase-promoting complex, cyclosome, subunit 4